MISIQVIIDFFAAGLLLATFLMMGKIRLVPMLRYFAIASFFLAGLGVSISIMRGEMDLVPAIATVLFKVIFIPLIIYFTSKRIPSSNQLRMYVLPATTYILFALVLVVSGIIVRNFPVNVTEIAGSVFFFRSLLFISITLILSGILLTIVRKDLFSQVLGILTMENGIAAFGLVALNGMPLFLEMGIFFVIIVSTVILAVLIDKVHEIYTTGDTAKLNELID
jgi:hydrogenase-4 component E